MKKLKSNRGAITILVLVTVLFFIAFLISLYIIISNKVQTQKEFISQTRKIYESDKTMEEIYNSYFSNDEVIPIYTADHFRKITTLDENNPLLEENATEKVIVNEENGKIYEYSAKSVYILKNDIYLNEEWYIDQLINGVILQTNGYKVIADGIEYPYTWIEDNFKEREILAQEDTLSEDILIKVANAKHDSGLSLECFTVGREFFNSTEPYEYVMYLYGYIYHETYVRDENGVGDGEASYYARAEKITLLNEICDGMLRRRFK